jgi:hypothetical protein
MIWRQAFDREVSVCGPGLSDHRHRQFLVNPNLSLLLICRQATEELKLVDVQYRFVVGHLSCAFGIRTILKPSQLLRIQVIVAACCLKPLPSDEKRVSRTTEEWLDQIKSERFFDHKGWECESVSLEDNSEKWQGRAMYDVVFTLKSPVDD